MSSLDYLLLLALVPAIVLALIYRREAARSKIQSADCQARFLQLFEEVPLACQEIDRNGVIRRVNRKLCDLVGREASSIIGTYYADFSTGADKERIHAE